MSERSKDSTAPEGRGSKELRYFAQYEATGVITVPVWVDTDAMSVEELASYIDRGDLMPMVVEVES